MTKCQQCNFEDYQLFCGLKSINKWKWQRMYLHLYRVYNVHCTQHSYVARQEGANERAGVLGIDFINIRMMSSHYAAHYI